jgi:uncharacterized membrane protein YphA (DoxX/SURF4 family)
LGTASPGSYMRLRLGLTVRVKPKSELEMGMLLDEPSPPVNFAASRTWILVRNSAPAYRWIWFHPTRLCEVGARSGRLHQRASRDGTALSFLLGWLTIIVELVGGLMILVGALIPLATVPMMIVLFVAIITVHLPNGFSSIKLQSFDAAGAHFGQPGYETDLLYLTSLLALCFGGPGPFSVDGWLNRLMGKHRVVDNKSSEISRA